jgi:hypothetical protein
MGEFMDAVAPRTSRSAGFSVAEALVALAIAAMLTGILTRLVSNTRMSAGKVRELVEMMTLSQSLLEETSQHSPKSSMGRTGRLAWRISVDPIAITAVARTVKPKSSTADQSTTPTLGLAPASEFAQDSAKAPSQPDEGANWIPYHVTILIESPTGRKYVTDTVNIGARPPTAKE